MPSLVDSGPMVLEKKTFKFDNVFLLFHKYLLLEKGVVLHLNKFDSFSLKDAFCHVCLKFAV